MAENSESVLGAFPVVIWALDKLAEPLEADSRHHNQVTTFRSDLELQRQCLDGILDRIELHRKTKNELRALVRRRFPSVADEVLETVEEMERLMGVLMKRLGVGFDAQANAELRAGSVRWTDVKYNIDTRRRKAVVDSLRRRNARLADYLEVSQSEAQAQDDSPAVQQLVKSFDASRCNALRQWLASLHGALSSGLCCTSCPAPHQAALSLDWRLYETPGPPDLDLAVSQRAVSSSQQTAPRWCKLSATPKPTAPAGATKSASGAARSLNTATGSAALSLPFRSGSGGSGASSRAPSPLRFQPTRSNAHAPSPSAATDAAATSLCALAAADSSGTGGPVVLRGTGGDPGVEFCVQSHRSSSRNRHHGITHRVPLEALCLPQHKRGLTDKARCGLAAYTAWSILHLGCSPWLRDDWDQGQVGVFLEKLDNDNEAFSQRSCFLYDDGACARSRAQPTLGTTSASRGNQGEQPSRRHGATPSEKKHNDPLQHDPSRAMRVLGIVLVELCLGLSCTPVDPEQQQGRGSRSPTFTSRYQRASDLVDRLYAKVGDSYANAAKKCIAFAFGGRDSINKLDMPAFRATFYRDVVAPLQATYLQFLT